MSPEQRLLQQWLEQIADALEALLHFEAPADRVLSDWFRARGKLGSRDRAIVAESVYYVLRHLRRLQAVVGEAAPLLQLPVVLGRKGKLRYSLALCGLHEALSTVFDTPELMRHTVMPYRAWLRQWMPPRWRPAFEGGARDLSPAVYYSMPDWLYEALDGAVEPARLPALLTCLLAPAPLDLRINPHAIERNAALQALREQGVDVQATPFSPYGLRVSGKPPVHQWSLFKAGQLEVQDEASQLVVSMLQPRRGEMIIDFCAGAGGKALLAAALMRSTGRVYAFDVSRRRLARLTPRLARSGVSNITPVLIEHERDARVKRLAGKADKVLVDAPCTGLGTLRRNPDLKWKLEPADLQALSAKQASILAAAARCVKPGGRLVYATCSLLPAENEHVVEAFLEAHPDFQLLPAQEALTQANIHIDGIGRYLSLQPDRHGTDGFFAAAMLRRAKPAPAANAESVAQSSDALVSAQEPSRISASTAGVAVDPDSARIVE